MNSDHSVAYIFPDFDSAIDVRQQLVENEEVSPERAWVDLREDEAGPTEGNFVIGTKRFDGKQTGDYKEQYQNPRIDGSVVLFVLCESARQAEAWGEMLRERGGTNLAERTAPGVE